MTLYETDADSPWGAGVPVTTQSMIKAWRMCRREVFYKYHLRLHPKVGSRPLERGKWFHALLEAKYKGEPWEGVHAAYVSKYRKLFDEEKEKLGDLPGEMDALMRSYLWHYREDADWEVVAVELTVEAQLPNGHVFRCRVDMVVRDRLTGDLWAVDHKTHKRLPDWDFRMLDEQSPLYIWALRENGYAVRGFIWNYVRSEGISQPRIVKAGTRFYANDGESDYPTYARAVRRGLDEFPETFLKDPDERAKVKAELARLKTMRYHTDEPQLSPHFRRDRLEKTDDLIGRVLAAATASSTEMHDYDFSDPDLIGRSIGSCKSFMCGFQSLTIADLVNGDSSMTQRREYRKGDPLAYYGTEDEKRGN